MSANDMGFYIRSAGGWEYRYAPDQPANLASLARRSRVGTNHLALSWEVDFGEEQSELAPWGDWAARGYPAGVEQVELPKKVTTAVFFEQLVRAPETRARAEALKQALPGATAVTLHAAARYQLSAADAPALLAWINERLPEPLQLTTDDLTGDLPTSPAPFRVAGHLPPRGRVADASAHLYARPTSAREDRHLRPLAVGFLYDLFTWRAAALDLYETESSWAWLVVGRRRHPYFSFGKLGL